jgi:hypothetical protein
MQKDPKSDFLGMPFGTASNRLKKNLMFSLAQKLGLTKCFQCGEEIKSPKDLSIEHKLPWFEASQDLFWDLDNVAFSHTGCNYSAARKALKKKGPGGTSWCSMCRKFLPKDNFHKLESRWNGVQHRCNECKSEAYDPKTGRKL